MKKIIISLLILLFVFSGPTRFQKASATDYSTVYDFVVNADSAKWYGGFGELSFPGALGDRTGYALWSENAVMEDRVSYGKILQVHPDVKDNGYIRGVYPSQTIPEKARLNVSFGFLMGGSETSGVTYTINFQAGRGQPIQLFQGFKTFTKNLENKVIDMTPYQGKIGNIILIVSSVKPSPIDLSAWVRVTLEKEKPEEVLPDLTISNIRIDQGKIFYTLKNIGAGTTPELRRGQFIQTQLSVDSKVVSSYQIARIINPGEEFEYLFPDYLLPKSKTEQVLRACADSLEFIKESNERNNCTEKIIPGEQPPEEGSLKFIRLPQVSAITTSSARFTWLMNNDSTAIIFYDLKFRTFSLKISDSNVAKIHDITLSNLKPGTLYEFYVQCVDKNGSIAKSSNTFFKTLSEPLKTKPTLQFVLPSELSGKISIKPILSDMKSFYRVRLYVDNHPVITNFTEPYNLELDTMKFKNGSHEIKMQGMDLNGNPYVVMKEGLIANKDLKLNQGPQITLHSPVNNTEYSNSTTVITLKATIDHKQKYNIHHLEVFVDGNLIHVAKPKKSTGAWATKDELPHEFTFDIPISYFAEGDHQVELRAFDSENIDNYVETVVKTKTPFWYKPALVLSYKTSLEPVNQCSYKVDFMITNNGNLPAKDITLQITQDILPGFIISRAYQGVKVVLYSDYQVLEFHLSELDFKNGKNVFHLYFDLSPVLKSPVNWSTDDYVIMKEVSLIYTWKENTKTPNWENWDIANHVSNDVFWMAKSADYLIMSNLKTLHMNNSLYKKALNGLLMSMAELASKKKGIIGLTNEMWLSPESVKQKILAWGDSLAPMWFSSGYLLIVGETEIVPSFTRSFNSGTSVVPTTDYPYADTTGNEMWPELTIGRIIGDNAYSLSKPIQASLDVANGTAFFYRNHHIDSKALCISGTGQSEDNFMNCVYWVDKIIEQEFSISLGYIGREVINQGVTLFNAVLGNCDKTSILFYCGHGSAYSWSGADDVALSWYDKTNTAYAGLFDFGSTRPFVFAIACDAGKYEGINGIANCLLAKAGAYIGSTALSMVIANNYNAKGYFDLWINHPEKSLATAFKEIRIKAFYNPVWNTEYQFYGDPKFGTETP